MQDRKSEDGLDINQLLQVYAWATNSGISERRWRARENPLTHLRMGLFDGAWRLTTKDLVGDAFGNVSLLLSTLPISDIAQMSISPALRDVVLAAYVLSILRSAHRGLLIIDVKAPFEVPRFLPQGGAWDAADVQWNLVHRFNFKREAVSFLAFPDVNSKALTV